MVDLASHGVSFALLQGQLLAGETSRSAFLDRASPLGAGTSEATAVADKVLAISDSPPVVHWDVLQVVGGPNNAVPWFAPNVPAANRNGMF